MCLGHTADLLPNLHSSKKSLNQPGNLDDEPEYWFSQDYRDVTYICLAEHNYTYDNAGIKSYLRNLKREFWNKEHGFTIADIKS